MNDDAKMALAEIRRLGDHGYPDGIVRQETQRLVNALGGSGVVALMTPASVAVYLIALMATQP